MTTYSFTNQGIRAPSRTRTRLITNTAISQSPLTGAIKTIVRAGTRWETVWTWENISGDDRRELLGFMATLNGQEHRVRLPVYDDPVRGLWTGTPLVKGAGQTGTMIACDGAVPATVAQVQRGDIISIENTLYMCNMQRNEVGGGDFFIDVTPPVREAHADNAPIEFTDPEGDFLLMDDVQYSNQDILANGQMVSTVELTFMEDIVA